MTYLDTHHDAVALIAIGDAFGSQEHLRGLIDACPIPMARWFRDQRHKIMSLALDAQARGDIPHDQGAAMDYLSRITWLDALDAIKGKPLVIKSADQVGDSALIGGKIMTLMSDAMMSRHENGLTYGSPNRVAAMLRHLAERGVLIDTMARTTAALAKVGIAEDSAPILAPLANLLRQSSTSVGERSIGDALGQAIASAERESANMLAGNGAHASWGLKSLDTAIPLRPGRLYVLSARPGGGKTSLGIQSAYVTSKALGFRSVAYLSLEMGSSELAMALACRECQIPRRMAEERWNELLPADHQALTQIAAQWTEEGSMWIRDAGAGPQAVSDVVGWIRAQRNRHNALRLVVIDYLGLIKGSNPKQFLLDKTAEITGTLKQIALSENVAIILLAQMTREGRKPTRGADGKLEADPVPRVEDLYGGGSIESDADGVVMLHPIEREGSERRVDAIIAKNRRGPFPLTCPLWFYGQWQHFQDVVTEQRGAIDHDAKQKQANEDVAKGQWA